MVAQKRDKQFDMFDVATGACTLEDYLFQRYSENDLSSVFWIDEKDEVDELRPPKPLPDGSPGTEPEIIPIQGPRAPKRESAIPKPPPLPEGLDPTPLKEPVVASSQTPTQATPPTADGMDSLVKSDAGTVPGQETFKKTAASTPLASQETFQSSGPEDKRSLEVLPGSTGGPTDVTPEQAPPSMQDLLAKFHQATKEYEERSGGDPTPEQETQEES